MAKAIARPADHPPRPRHRRAGIDGADVRPIRHDHRLHLAPVPALRRDLRRAVPVRRPVHRAAARGTWRSRGSGCGTRRSCTSRLGRCSTPMPRSTATASRRCGSEDCQVVLSTGSGVRLEDLGPPPPNFIVQPYVPQLEVLRRAAAFVTHGGMNSVSESSRPRRARRGDSPDGRAGDRRPARRSNSAPVWSCRRPAVTVEALRAAVRRVLSDESYRRQAAQVGETFRAAGGVGRAADAILAFTRGSRPPRDQTASSPTLQP